AGPGVASAARQTVRGRINLRGCTRQRPHRRSHGAAMRLRMGQRAMSSATTKRRRSVAAAPAPAALDDADAADVRDAFSLFDGDRNGRVDYYELRSALRALGIDPAPSELASLLASADSCDFATFAAFGASRARTVVVSMPHMRTRAALGIAAGRLAVQRADDD